MKLIVKKIFVHCFCFILNYHCSPIHVGALDKVCWHVSIGSGRRTETSKVNEQVLTDIYKSLGWKFMSL